MARINFPAEWFPADRCDVMEDGNGRLAFAPSTHGTYAVYPLGKASKQRAVTIPGPFKAAIPFGTTDVELSKDGEMYILDLNALGAHQEAAE